MRNGISGVYANRLSNRSLASGVGLFVFCFFALAFLSSIGAINEGALLMLVSIGMSFGIIANGIYFRCRPFVNVDDDCIYVKFAAARPKIKIHHDDILYMTRHERHYEVPYQRKSNSKMKRCKLPYNYFNASGLAQLHSLAMSYYH